MVLPIYIDPHPILRQTAQPVESITPDLIDLVQQMRQTMHQAKGMGLAAPQIGRSLQLFILEYLDDDGTPIIPFTTIINPQFTWKSTTLVPDDEACLSVPGVSGIVQRPKAVKLEFTDLDGERYQLKADGLLARSLQHEYDHLIGKLFTDYIPESALKKYAAPPYPQVKV